MGKITPLMKPAAGDRRKATASETPGLCPTRPSGCRAAIWRSTSGRWGTVVVVTGCADGAARNRVGADAVRAVVNGVLGTDAQTPNRTARYRPGDPPQLPKAPDQCEEWVLSHRTIMNNKIARR
jgi:hypothetical protein